MILVGCWEIKGETAKTDTHAQTVVQAGGNKAWITFSESSNNKNIC